MARITPELQVTPIEAGLCCAAMLLHAAGCRVPTSALREEVDLGRSGSTLPQLAELFSVRGVVAEVRQVSAAEAEELPGPFIAGWGNSSYVVVERFRTSTVVLVDPASGRRRAPVEEFGVQFSGMVLIPRPAPDVRFAGPGRDPGTPRPFRAALRAAAAPLAGVLLTSVLVYATDIGAPYLTQRVIDQALVDGRLDIVGDTLPWVLGIVAAVGLGIYLRSVFTSRSAVVIGGRSAQQVLDHLLGLPYKYFDARQPGELSYRLAGISAIRDSLSDQLFAGFFQIGGLLVYLGYLFTRSVPLALVATGFVAAMLLVLFGSRAVFYSAIQNEQSQTGRMLTEQLEAIQSILTIKTQPDRHQFLTRWRRQNAVSLRYLRRRMLLQGGVNAVTGVLQFSGPIVTLVVGLVLWQRGGMSLGTVFGALAIASMIFATANAIYGSVALFLVCRTYARRIEDITTTRSQPVGTRPVRRLGRLGLHGVGYRYTRHTPAVVRDVDLTVEPGTTVALVGRTGSGKSTLAKLALGLYPSTTGSVTFDGVPVGDVVPGDLFSRLAFVPQDVTLETATLHDNVALGRDVTRADVEEACRVACVHEDVLRFPAGYETMVNNLGANLSGGQRQRIALARAVLARPEFLVLDEATSSLDTATERTVARNLAALGCTTLLIAHRLASVAGADVVHVLDAGRVVQSGRPDDLLLVDGPFRDLFAPRPPARETVVAS